MVEGDVVEAVDATGVKKTAFVGIEVGYGLRVVTRDGDADRRQKKLEAELQQT